MTKRDDKHNERLAYHEAGHALVARQLGYRVIRTTIEKKEIAGPEGETIAIHPDASIIAYLLGRMGMTDERDDEDKIAYLMAGVEAVRLAGCEKTISIEGSELSDDIIEARNDILKAMTIAKRLGRGAKFLQDLKFESGKSKATILLEKNIAALNAIATALIESKTLSEAEIARIVESHSPPKRTKRDRIPVNAVCAMGPCAVFDTDDDVTLYEMSVINGDWLAANRGSSHFWLQAKVNIDVMFHGPYQGYVGPDAPESTCDALSLRYVRYRYSTALTKARLGGSWMRICAARRKRANKASVAATKTGITCSVADQ